MVMAAVGETEPPDLEPMTLSLLGRWFGVPMLIIGTIVGGAVVVVLLFGGPASPEQRSIESLLQALEASSGERSAGVLLPREKELWQTALELSERLAKKDTELTADELQTVTQRLATMVQTDLAHVDRITAFGEDLAKQQELRSGRFDFLLRALARTEREEAIEPLTNVVSSGREPYVAVAMQQLGNLHGLVGSKRAVEPIVAVLGRSSRAETLLTACTALSVLASRDDRGVLDALATARLTHDGEVAWSAALALARLGSAAGKSTLLDLLDRTHLASGERYEVRDDTGNVKRYPLPPNRVEALLIAAMDAAANLNDDDLWGLIDRLKSDPSPAVRGRAMELTKRRAQSGGGKP
jgi:hypothetical protein